MSAEEFVRPHRDKREKPMAKEILCAFGVDVDAVAGWLGSYGGEDSPLDISRGMFSGEVGTPRLVKLFERFGIKTTWFVPGHSMETFPQQIRMVVDAGHEIGLHGYSHENPIAMSREQEEAVLHKCIELAQKVTGRRPTGTASSTRATSSRSGGTSSTGSIASTTTQCSR